MMDEERELEALLGEFLPDEEEMERQIEEEWERMHARGETIREGDAPKNLHFRWMMAYGLDFFSTLQRQGWLAKPDDSEGDE
jgi:hypothetical protein